MIRALLDANTIVSGAIGIHRPDSSPGIALRSWFQGSFDLLMSEPLLIEINRTLSKPFFLERVSHDFAQTLVASLGEWAIWTEITDVVNSVATHPEDDVILSIAISAPADFLVTGDKQLLRLQRIGGCEIVGVAAFLSELGLRATEVATLENEPE